MHSTSARSTRAFPNTPSTTSTPKRLSGRVTFPLAYEGPPGLVHGGFLAVFFDSVTQHQSCAAKLTGKTRSLTVKFRRPTPILTELRFDIVRAQTDGQVTSTARLLLDDEVLCIGELNTVASSPDKLTGVQFGKRRDKNRVTELQRIRQPRVAEIVAARLREDILSGRIKEGDVLPSQESLFSEFGVSPPALREAIHILETDGLISVRRGNVGGAVVHPPSAERTAHMISMVLQARSATPADVSGALLHLEPICAGMCAAREDRMTEVVPYLEAEIELQTEQFDNLSRYVPNARRFHEAVVSRCGNEPMILLIGSLELIWSAHESSVWSDEGDPMEHKTMRAALRDHQRLLDAIRDGNSARAVRLAQDHLAAARRNTLAVGADKTIEAKLISKPSSSKDT